MTLVGTLGQGKLLVLYPAFRGDPGGQPIAFGIQRTLARRLKACGRPSAFTLARTRVESIEFEGDGPPPMRVGDIALAVADAWADDEIARLLVQQFACRWGVVADMTAAKTNTRLHTRLFEADPAGQARPIAESHFDGDNLALPGEIHAIVQEVSRRTGVRCLWPSWQDLFDSHDPIAALLTLRLTGILSGIEEGVAYERELLLGELWQLLETAPRSSVAIDLIAEVLRALHERAASPLHLLAWLGRARGLAGRPAAWAELDEELARPVA